MPYYCTVPRCTSMAGKVKDVSFHQFPKDKELAKLWNEILKRGKPYTKYSKVCSLHFKPDDYTITGLGKNKGQWRTLRKDAVPSQNLPSDSPVHSIKNRNRGLNLPTGIMDTQLQQVAQAIYMQTMLAVNATKVGEMSMTSMCNEQGSPNRESSSSMSSNSSGQFNETMSQIEHLLYKNKINNELPEDLVTKNYINESSNTSYGSNKSEIQDFSIKQTYKCIECSKCFKDPDVFFLHKRTHVPKNQNNTNILRKTLTENVNSEKENHDNNIRNNFSGENSTEDTLKANPILANLLNSMPQTLQRDEIQQELDSKSVTSIEKQMMAAMTLNMKNYFRNLSSMMTQVAILSNKNINEEIDNLVYGMDNDSRECNGNLNLMKETNEQQGMQLDDDNDRLNSELD
ncbi:PREDICTED: uncharacterized protein LOC106106954 [Papilio polytes]|uniref:uncharacterized protein LOC106106954 n=1 Tax=Papilio polytes TaxID=76194 RepID=UPI000675E3E7|nr:PREDICTED: uncharacterized protein LOC106106954 [Papilio polytes]